MNINRYGIYYVCCVLMLTLLPVIFARDIILSDLNVGRYIDFSVPERIEAARALALWGATTWFDALNGGFRNSFATTINLQNLLLYGPSYWTNSTWFLGRWALLFPLAVSGVSYFIFFEYFRNYFYASHKSGDCTRLLRSSFLLSCIFTYSNFNFSELQYGSSNYVFSCALMPLAVAFFHKGCLDGKIGSTTLASLVLTCICGGILQNLVILLFIYCFVFHLGRFKYSYAAKYFALFILLSLYWILPIIQGASDVMKNELAVTYIPTATPLFDIFGARSYSALSGRIHYEHLIPSWVALLYWVVAGLFVALPFYFSITDRAVREKISLVSVFGLLLVTSIFALKGSHDPFGNLNIFAYEHVPFIALFRTVSRFWPIFYISLAFMHVILMDKKHYGSLVMFFGLIMCSPWLLNSDLGIRAQSEKIPTLPRINLYKPSLLPKSFETILNEDENFRIWTSPMSSSPRFVDGGGETTSQGGDTDLVYGGKGIFSSDSVTSAFSMGSLMEYQMYTTEKFLLNNADLFNILGVKYFIVRKNRATEFSVNRGYEQHNMNYGTMMGVVSKVDSDQDSDVYQFSHYLPRIYLPKDRTELSHIKEKVARYDTAIYDEFRLNEASIESQWNVGNLVYSKVSDSVYRVTLDSVQGRLPLLLNVNFNKDWILLPIPSDLNMVPLFIKSIVKMQEGIEHFRAPMARNGWMIDSDYVCERMGVCNSHDGNVHTLSLYIVFKAQLYLIVGAIVSLFVFGYIFLLILFRRISLTGLPF